jgi:multiple sugar transport system substrate-binding protein
VGGDVLGISATTEKEDAAWDFVAWTVSEEAQVEIMAKNKDVVGRTDLANNKYSAEDERVVTINELVEKGVTPYSLNFGATYNDPTGPWLNVARDALYGDDVQGALTGGKEPLTDSLGQQ